jgi:hypothetical protein
MKTINVLQIIKEKKEKENRRLAASIAQLIRKSEATAVV